MLTREYCLICYASFICTIAKFSTFISVGVFEFEFEYCLALFFSLVIKLIHCCLWNEFSSELGSLSFSTFEYFSLIPMFKIG